MPPRAQRPIVDLPVLLTAKVAASQRDQPVSTRVSVVLEEQVVGQLNVTVQPGRPATASLAVTPKKAGTAARPLRAADRRISRRQYLLLLPERRSRRFACC